jgi:hypothetical protein
VPSVESTACGNVRRALTYSPCSRLGTNRLHVPAYHQPRLVHSPDTAGLFVSDPSARALRDANESAGKLTMTTLTAAKNRFERHREFATLEVRKLQIAALFQSNR